ncbi:fimbrial protein domain-containing protein [Anopheles sinensis]|uniref:Fimbrial protein domain-containing protein n=1 Tax=Anopheles sinensis TaxID=74873 RepID=A0A084VKL7_ANOSI|nr:fimbrial protein domain-containing protein [Anopheles sinensis]
MMERSEISATLRSVVGARCARISNSSPRQFSSARGVGKAPATPFLRLAVEQSSSHIADIKPLWICAWKMADGEAGTEGINIFAG